MKKSGRNRQRGAAIVEVALLVGLVAMIGIVSIQAMGKNVKLVMFHAEAGITAGTGGVEGPWCNLNPTDPICS